MVLAKKYGYVTVISVVPFPAAKVGLTTGDMLESIKGIATRDMPLAHAKLLLKGQPGTTVDLSVLRRKPEPQKLTMTREVVNHPAVESKLLPDQIGYIAIPSMSQGKIKEEVAAACRVAKAGREEVDHRRPLLRVREPADGIELRTCFR